MRYPKEYLQYATAYRNKMEVINHCLWDTQALTAATLNLAFFQAVGATPDISNMEIGGQLPSPKSFLVRAIRFFIKQVPESVNSVAVPGTQTGAISNVALILNTGALTLTIGSKQYGTYPLWAIPAGGGPYGVAGLHNILIAGAYWDYGNCGLPHSRNLLTLSQPLWIPTQMNFRVDIVWAAALATITRTVPICVCLEGDLIRQVQ